MIVSLVSAFVNGCLLGFTKTWRLFVLKDNEFCQIYEELFGQNPNNKKMYGNVAFEDIVLEFQ